MTSRATGLILVAASMLLLTPTSLAASASVLPPATVVGLGDSVTAGSYCACRDYVYRYGDLVRTRTNRVTTVHNFGRGGETAHGLRVELAASGALSRAVAGARVVLVTIGANDFYPEFGRRRTVGCDHSCWGPRASAVGHDIRAIIARIHQLRSGQRTLILVTNYWNVFEDGRIAMEDYGPVLQSWTDQVTRGANAVICSNAVAMGARCADLYTPFKAADGRADPTELLADDGDHPNAAGHALIAQVLARTRLPWLP